MPITPENKERIAWISARLLFDKTGTCSNVRRLVVTTSERFGITKQTARKLIDYSIQKRLLADAQADIRIGATPSKPADSGDSGA